MGFQVTCLAGQVAEACICDACEVSSTYQLHVIFQCICQHYIYNNFGLTCFLKHNQNSYKSRTDLDTLIMFFMFAVIFKPSHHVYLNNFTWNPLFSRLQILFKFWYLLIELYSYRELERWQPKMFTLKCSFVCHTQKM